MGFVLWARMKAGPLEGDCPLGVTCVRVLLWRRGGERQLGAVEKPRPTRRGDAASPDHDALPSPPGPPGARPGRGGGCAGSSRNPCGNRKGTDQQVQAVQVGLDVVGVLGGHAPELLQLRTPCLPDNHGEGDHPLDALLYVAPLIPCDGIHGLSLGPPGAPEVQPTCERT